MSLLEENENLLKELESRSPTLATHLRAAFENLARPGAIYLKLAAHAIREFGYLLPVALELEVVVHEDAKQALRAVAPDWQALSDTSSHDVVVTSSEPGGHTTQRTIDPALFRKTKDAFLLMGKAQDFVFVMVAMVRALDPYGNQAYHASAETSVRQWFKLHDWFVRKSHERDLDRLENQRAAFLANVELYVVSLRAVFARAIDTLPELMTLAASEPSTENVERAIALLKKAELRRRFFVALQNPAWLEPLEREGFFKDPYNPVRTYDPVRKLDLVSSPFWPQSQYLIVAARVEGKRAASIIQRLGSTENEAVRVDFVTAASEMPIEDAVTLVPTFRQWLERPVYGRIPLALGKLTLSLLERGAQKPALRMVSSLLGFDPPTGGPQYLRRVRARLERYEVALVLKDIHEPFVETCGHEYFHTLCALLSQAITLEDGVSAGEAGEHGDFSYIWMESLDSTEEYPDDLKESLAAAVARSALVLAERSSQDCERVLRRTAMISLTFFQRLRLRVLATGRCDMQATREALLDRGALEDDRIRAEYDRLLKSKWPALEPGDKNTIVGWIREGPDLTWMVQNLTRRRGATPPEEEIQEYRARLQLTRLTTFVDLLEGEARSFYESLRETVEPFEQPSRRVTSWTGPNSPLTAEELEAKTPTEILEFLRVWVPQGSTPKPSPEGLLRALIPVVSKDAKVWAALAPSFKDGIPPTYVRAFIEGITESAEDAELAWPAVLDLCRWVLEQPDVNPDPREDEVDPGWSWTRRAVADLVRGGVRQGLGLPFKLREDVWHLVETLSRDSDPIREIAIDGSRDLLTEALNSTRGKALHAAVEYALWCVRNLTGAGEATDPWFDAIPEVHSLFEEKLDPAREPSESVRSVFLQYIPNLGYLGPEWLKQALPKLLEPLGRLWEVYLEVAPVYRELVPVLGPIYLKAVQQPFRTDKKKSSEIGNHLAGHILLLHAHFHELLPADSDLVEEFFKNASVQQRAHVISFAGWHVKEDQKMGESTLTRIMAVVEERITIVARSDNPDHREELANWATIFGASRFPNGWLVQMAKLATPVSPRQRMEHVMAERVASIADSDLSGALEVLSLAAKKDLGPMGIHNWEEAARKILAMSIKSGGELKARAEETINAFTEQGLGQFEALLNPPS